MLRTFNRILVRGLIVCLAILAGIMYADATNMFGMTGLRVNNNLIIQNNFTWNGTTGGPPRGAMIFWDATTCPTGWTQVTTYNGRFPRGASSAGTTGGASTHTHTSAHTHTGGSYSTTANDHSHYYSGSEYTDSSGTNHAASGCGVNDGVFDIWGCSNIAVDGDPTDTDSHDHYTYWAYADAQSYHSHGVSSGGLSASGSASGTNSSVPAYYNLTICRKW